MNAVLSVVLVTLGCAGMSCIAYYKKLLDAPGAVIGFFIGFIIGVFGDISWLIMLLVFLASSFAATKYKYALKKKMGVAESEKGRRTMYSVLANGYIPTLIAFLSYQNPYIPYFEKKIAGIMFLTALCVAASDTLASEIGVLSNRVYLITNFKRVERGTNGGISFLGSVVALATSLYAAVCGWMIISLISDTLPSNSAYIILTFLLGFLGCNIDSVLGATVEDKTFMNKDRVNLVSIAISSLIAYAIMSIG